MDEYDRAWRKLPVVHREIGIEGYSLKRGPLIGIIDHRNPPGRITQVRQPDGNLKITIH